MVIDASFVVGLKILYKETVRLIGEKLIAFRTGMDNSYQKAENDMRVCFSTGRAIIDYEYSMDILTDAELKLFYEILLGLHNKYAPMGSRYSPLINPVLPSPYPLVDLDGNQYTTVIIGSQEWIIEPFKSTKYSNGDTIPEITDQGLWDADIDGARCAYDNNSTYVTTYGYLYNYYAIQNSKNIVYLERNGVQESGWRIPSQSDLNTLISFLGGSSVAGGKAKESGLTHWNTPNTDADNSSGFTSLPGGTRNNAPGTFENIGNNMLLWVTPEASALTASFYLTYYNSASFSSVVIGKDQGCTIKLVRSI